MRIYLHIGPDGPASDRLQRVLDAKRDQLAGKGVLYARSPGARNHTRVFMAVTDAVDSLRFNRGFIAPEKQQMLFDEVQRGLMAEVARVQPDTLILSAHQLGATLSGRDEIARLKALLAPLSDDIRIVAHVDDPARLAVRRYAAQLLEGRAQSLALELGLLDADNWWDAALATRPDPDPQSGQFGEVQGAMFWLDYARLVQEWDAVFGPGATRLRSLDLGSLYSEAATEELRAAFDIADTIGKAEPETLPAPPSAAWMTRCRMMNDAILRLLARGDAILPRQLWRKFLGEIKVHGDPIAPGSLSALSLRFEKDIKALAADHPGLDPAAMKRDRKRPDWSEADPTLGFRATQYLMAFRWRIQQATKEERAIKAADLTTLSKTPARADETPADSDVDTILTPTARELMPPLAKQNFLKLQRSTFAPHNRLGHVNEEALAAAYPPAPPRVLPAGSSGNVIVGCMKNEAPYILEWIAYHRAIGVDDFLIYTNGCEDGTSELLDRLQAMGVLQHRNNDDWKGNSPQQHALNNALKEPVIRNADWIIHIDVDEFMNIRCGNGTLDDFFERVPDATNVAMTWRLFGHNGVHRLADEFVIDQFDTCAPKYCPKPHTVWGFKTMFRNIGAYQKISCHRPNKLSEAFESKVKWVNGSGLDMTHEVAKNGWRNSKKTIGYDLLQLNHYALRSAESFLIKRQRGRALHVDRSIGINYWIRMDWSDFRDITIKRNIPRVRAEYDRLMADPQVAEWHTKGLDWHRAKAAELHGMPEFEDLYQQALKLRLTETERVAYALALDMES
ncbi:glycosyltransferase family 2 protein [Aestuariicoccus sp. MJ-SS9]|uniref:glycosyltransferase family 2 protein n=1 Tax=Aestuariicoccus sp. MJ-SS9 TaxID=3079855 RepID=UPI00290B275B|nr:glycosyltransferase family 2 protein [Aestuariicoccus sp. MJ-SS9]MDU8913340.1 glycosyltransferase family 2 protein [Aestuariicoccus sp. MJ-SS9]